jgi:hypothetical protein
LTLGLTGASIIAAGPAGAASCTTYTSPSAGLKWTTTREWAAGSGFCIQSTVGGGKLLFQSDGNLVLYKGSKAVWSSKTSGHGMQFELHGYTTSYTTDGRLYVIGCTGSTGTGCGTNLWKSSGGTYNDQFILQIGNVLLGGGGAPCLAESSKYGSSAWAQTWTSNGQDCFSTLGAG